MPMALRRRLEIRLRSRQENRSLAIGEGGSAERLQCIFRTGVPSSVACARWLRARRSELAEGHNAKSEFVQCRACAFDGGGDC